MIASPKAHRVASSDRPSNELARAEFFRSMDGAAKVEVMRVTLHRSPNIYLFRNGNVVVIAEFSIRTP